MTEVTLSPALCWCKTNGRLDSLHAHRPIGWGARNPEPTPLATQEAALNRVLQPSRRVGDLLLKEEGAELNKVAQLTDELLKKSRCALLLEQWPRMSGYGALRGYLAARGSQKCKVCYVCQAQHHILL